MQEEFGVVRVLATLDNEECAEGELMFHFVNLPSDKIRQSREELYGIVTRGMQVVADADPS
jgi:hypothetical protein